MIANRGTYFKTPLKDLSNLETAVVVHGNVFDKECDAASVLANSLFNSALQSPSSSLSNSVSGDSPPKSPIEPRIKFFTSPRNKGRMFSSARSSTRKMFAYSFNNVI